MVMINEIKPLTAEEKARFDFLMAKQERLINENNGKITLDDEQSKELHMLSFWLNANVLKTLDRELAIQNYDKYLEMKEEIY